MKNINIIWMINKDRKSKKKKTQTKTERREKEKLLLLCLRGLPADALLLFGVEVVTPMIRSQRNLKLEKKNEFILLRLSIVANLHEVYLGIRKEIKLEL